MYSLPDELEQEYFAPLRSARRKERVPRWMISFADLLSLLLTFFVMIYSATAIQNEKWSDVVAAFNKEYEFGRVEKNPNVPEISDGRIEAEGTNLAYLQTVFRQRQTLYPALQAGTVRLWKGRLILSFPVSYFSGLDPAQAPDTYESLAGTLKVTENKVEIMAALPESEKPWPQTLVAAHIQELRKVATTLQVYGYNRPLDVAALSAMRYFKPGEQAGDYAKPRIDFIVRPLAAVQ